MKIGKFFRASVGGIAVLLVTFAFLPVLLIDPEIEIFQNLIKYINKD